MAVLRSCFNEIFSTEKNNEVGLWQVIPNCVIEARYNCAPFLIACPPCSASTYCDFSRPKKLSVNSTSEVNEITSKINIDNLTGVDISYWNLVGEHDGDDNRLSDWGIQKAQNLTVFKAIGCSLPHLTEMVSEVIVNNQLTTLDISNNPLDCCKLSLLYPYPALNFSPYTCKAWESSEFIAIDSADTDPFKAGNCVLDCSTANKVQCRNYCPDHTFNDIENRCEASPIRSCLSNIYSIYPRALAGDSSDVGLWNVIDDCYPGARYKCGPFAGHCPICSNSSYCDFSRYTKLATSTIFRINEVKASMNFTLLTGLDLSNWNLVGEGPEDNNRFEDWGLENAKQLESFLAVNCSLPFLTPIVNEVLQINKNTLVNLDVSNNPFDCCKIYSLYPFPAKKFTPYTCKSPVTSELIHIQGTTTDPYTEANCNCSLADKSGCYDCPGYFYDEQKNACLICPVGSACLHGVAKECEIQFYKVSFVEGSSECIEGSVIRSCLNVQYQVDYLEAKSGSRQDPIGIVSYNCTESCKGHSICLQYCSSSTFCDFSFTDPETQLSLIDHTKHFSFDFNLELATGYNISSRYLRGVNFYKDNNRLGHWGLQNSTKLKRFIATNCHMTTLTDMVLDVITKNSLELLDISENPLNCCLLNSLFPYPATNFTPYSCLNPKFKEIFIQNKETDPFLAGNCLCSQANEELCLTSKCNGYEFDHERFLCTECPAGFLCQEGKRTRCLSGFYSVKGSEFCKQCALKATGCKIVGECDVETGDALGCAENDCELGWFNSNGTCIQQTCLIDQDASVSSVILNEREFPIKFEMNLTTFSQAQESIRCPTNFFGTIYRICGGASTKNSTAGSTSIVSRCTECNPIEECLNVSCTNLNNSICLECKNNFYYLNENQTKCLPCISNITNCKFAECHGMTCKECLDGFFLTKLNTCDSCPQGCTKCSSFDYCETCELGFNLDDNQMCIEVIQRSSLSAGAISGISVGTFVALAIILVAISLIIVKRLRNTQEKRLLKKRGAEKLQASNMGIMTDDAWKELKSH
eukprot:Awhi_evm1s906